MRLKEIEQRLAAIRTELTTRGADMTDEEVATLEQEVTDLQEERKGLLAAQERRKKLLENIAAGNPVDDKSDLQLAGVVNINENDALIIRAVTLFVKAEFNYQNAADRYRQSYEALKMSLCLAGDYNTKEG